MGPDTQATTLRDLFKIFFKHKLLIIFTFIPAVIIIYVILELFTPVYQAKIRIMIVGVKTTRAPLYSPLGSSTRDQVGTLIELVRSRHVIERVVKALKLYETPPDYEKQFASPLKKALIEYNLKKFNRLKKSRGKSLTPEEEQSILIENAIDTLINNIGAQPVAGTNLFEIYVNDLSPIRAAIIANSVSRSYLIFDIEQQTAELQLQYGEKYEQVIQLKNYVKNLEETLDGRILPDIDAMGPSSIKIVEQATAPNVPAQVVDKIRIRMVVSVMSIALGLVLALIVEYFNQTFKSPTDIETFLNIQVLGSIPKRKFKDKLPIGRDTNPATDYTLSFHRLSERLSLMMQEKNLRSVLITGVESPESIATVIAGLGICSARRGDKKVLIIGANLRDSSLSEIFNISNKLGLADVLEGRSLFEDVVQNLEPNLYILPRGDTISNPTTLLSSPSMADVISSAEKNYEILFLYGANIRDFTDAIILSTIINGVILVIDEGKTKRQVVKSAIAPLEQGKANLIGAILNSRTFVLPKWIYDRI